MLKRLVCALLLPVLLLTGCARGGESAGASASAGSAAGASASSSVTTDGENTVYDCGGTRIALPTKYVDQLVITVGGDSSGSGTPLLSVSEKASVEAGKADGIDGSGFLFSFVRMDRAQYESYLSYDSSGMTAFAVTGKSQDPHLTAPTADTYYVYCTATDVQYYRSGGVIDTQSTDWKNWETLLGLGSTVQADMITRNGLTAYSDDEFRSQEFTYTGDHVYVKYHPTSGADGSSDDSVLVLSQPVTQGDGGIWCVERWYDGYGNCYTTFPAAEDVQASTTAETYFSQLQSACDAKTETDDQKSHLTALGAAKEFVSSSSFFGKAEGGSFTLTQKPAKS